MRNIKATLMSRRSFVVEYRGVAGHWSVFPDMGGNPRFTCLGFLRALEPLAPRPSLRVRDKRTGSIVRHVAARRKATPAAWQLRVVPLLGKTAVRLGLSVAADGSSSNMETLLLEALGLADCLPALTELVGSGNHELSARWARFEAALRAASSDVAT